MGPYIQLIKSNECPPVSVVECSGDLAQYSIGRSGCLAHWSLSFKSLLNNMATSRSESMVSSIWSPIFVLLARVMVANMHSFALSSVESHSPFGCRSHQHIQAHLELLPVRFTGDEVHQLRVICKFYKERD